MKTILTQVAEADARTAVRKSLGFRIQDQSGRVVGPELCAEALRMALWSLWSVDQQPVYVTRLTGAVTRILLPWHSDEEGETIQEQTRSALQELEVIGDLAALPNGRWAPVPTRFVRLPAIGKYLILGSIPGKLFSIDVKIAIIRNGVARLINNHPDSLGLQVPELPIQEWLRLPSESLPEWTRSVLNSANLEPAGELQVEVYAPALVAPYQDQYFRWSSVSRRIANGLYVARTRIRRGSTSYSIVQINDGQLVATGIPDLGDGDIRRLLYGIDMLYGKPVRVLAQRNRKQCSFKLGNELPRAEYRQFMTIGSERLPTNDKYYPRWWDVPSDYVPEAERALRNLGIEVDLR